MYIYIYIYIYMCVCVCMCKYIYMCYIYILCFPPLLFLWMLLLLQNLHTLNANVCDQSVSFLLTINSPGNPPKISCY